MSSDCAFGGVDERREVLAEMVSFGERLMDAGHSEGALKYFRRMVRIYPESHASFAYLGELYLKMGDRERARKHFAKSLELFPDNQEVLVKLAEIGGAK